MQMKIKVAVKIKLWIKNDKWKCKWKSKLLSHLGLRKEHPLEKKTNTLNYILCVTETFFWRIRCNKSICNKFCNRIFEADMILLWISFLWKNAPLLGCVITLCKAPCGILSYCLRQNRNVHNVRRSKAMLRFLKPVQCIQNTQLECQLPGTGQ